MTAPHPLVERFARAGLPLEVARAPLGRGVGLERIVQLDIARARGRERFLVWPGDAWNRLEVEGLDRQLHQLVLLVHEPARTFDVEVSRYANVPAANVVRREGRRRWVRERTADTKRHFLMGLDERHLFIAQLPRGASAVSRAHLLLKPAQVRAAEASAGVEAVRQGEWFFVRAPGAQQRALDELARAPFVRLVRSRGIAQVSGERRGGRPHVADEVLVTLGNGRVPPALQNAVFVRGAVRHPDHATLVFREWFQAIGNSEARAVVSGMTWVD